MYKLIVLFLVAFLLASCLSTNGKKLNIRKLEIEEYKKNNYIYIYRTSCFQGSLAAIILELNNKNIGILGMKQMVEAPIEEEQSFVTAVGEGWANNYSIILNTVKLFLKLTKLMITKVLYHELL